MGVVGSSSVESTIAPQRLGELLREGRAIELIDVRTPAEYRSVHATIARLVPLDGLDPRAVMASRQGTAGDPLYVICRSGTRGEKAVEKFRTAGYSDVVNVAGGTVAWERAGLPVVRGKRMLPLDRQVQLTAGIIALAGFGLGESADPRWFLLSGFVGLGLVFAGVTGFCPLGWLIARMPWNQAGREAACRRC